MRLLFVAPGFKPQVGGVAEYTHQLATHLALEGDEVTVLAPMFSVGGDVEDWKAPYHIRRYRDRFRGSKARLWTRVRGLILMCRLIGKTIDETDPDVVVINQLHCRETRAGMILSTVKKVPYALVTYGRDVTLRGGNRGGVRGKCEQGEYRHLLRRACLVLCVSRFTRQAVVDSGCREDRTLVVRPGVIVPQEFETQEGDGELNGVDEWANREVVLTVCRLVERKGVDRAIEAVACLRREFPRIVLIIVGSGPDLERLRRLVKALGLVGHVKFLGEVSEEEKVEWYRRAKVFLMPNRELEDGDVEGFGIVFLEASSHGVPVVGGRSGGVVDAIEEGRTGYLVEPEDVHEIAERLRKLLVDDELRGRMGREGRAWVQRERSWGEAARATRKGLAACVQTAGKGLRDSTGDET